MFGLSFLNSVFLAGLAAAALPIIIHLFSRRRAKEIAFPSLEYLREISRRKIRRMRLRQWLLLALRVLIVAFFAMAMGRPALRGRAGVMTRGSSTIAIVLDNSYSMSAADPTLTQDVPRQAAGDRALGRAGKTAGAEKAGERDQSNSPVEDEGTLFLLAKDRALEVCDLMGEGDHGVLALCGRPVNLPLPTPVTDAGLLRQEIKRASLLADRSDLPTALSQVLPILQSARTMNRELFIISDFQRRDVEEWIHAGTQAGATAADSAGASRALKIPEGIKVYLIPVRQAGQENASIERVRYDANQTSGRVGRLIVTVVNQGEEPISDRILRALEASGNRASLSDAAVDLPPRGRGDFDLNLNELPADGGVEVQLGSDALELDNRAYLVTRDPGVRKVLLVTGAPEEGRFIKTALDPAGNGEFFQVRQVEPGALADPANWTTDVVILSDVGRLPEAGVENLRRFKAQGGGVLIGLGDRTELRSANTDILSRLSSIELLNVVSEAGEGAYRTLRPTVLAHPIFSGFPLGPGDELGSARFHKLVSCRFGPNARVVAEFGRDIPALCEEDGVFLFTSDFEGQWNDLVTSASFPPLLHLMVRYLAGRGAEDQKLGLVGARLESLLPEGTVQGPVTCVDPMGGQSQVEAVPVERMIRLRSQPASWPGIYRFVDAAGKTVLSFAVNLDTKEGDLSVASAQAEAKLLGPDSRRLDVGKPINRELLAGRYGRELWRVFLVVVLMLLAVESVLGRGRLLG